MQVKHVLATVLIAVHDDTVAAIGDTELGGHRLRGEHQPAG